MPPVSVCHQLSWMIRFEHFFAPDDRFGVERFADAGEKRRWLRSYTSRGLMSRRIRRRMAVGAVYQTVTF